MNTDLLIIELSFMALGLVLGCFIMWLYAKLKFSKNVLTPKEVQERYVMKEVYENLQQQVDVHKDDLLDKEQEIRNLSSQLSAKSQQVINFEEKLNSQKEELNNIQSKFQLEFENVANRLLEDKSQKFTQQNQVQLHNILGPLKEKIKDFEAGIEKRYIEETKDKISLKKEIEHLRELNVQLSQDANNLASALKGESKTQGDWGEYQLEMLLEKAGLVKDIHFTTQHSFKDDDGKDKRPDFIINLPEKKHLVIDSKVSSLL